MTQEQLKQAVIHLGFAATLEENDALFREAALRALTELSAIRPRTRDFLLHHIPLPLILRHENTELLTKKKTFRVPTSGSLRASVYGDGILTVTVGEECFVYRPFSGPVGYPAQINASWQTAGREAQITFSPSSETWTLLSLAVYSTITAPGEQEHCRVYDLKSQLKDFLYLEGPPEDEKGRPLREVRALPGAGEYILREGNKLLLSGEHGACIRLRYRERPALPEAGELPLDEDIASLLPLLTAAYVWLESEPEKSDFYLARYREGLALLRHPSPPMTPYPDRTRW